jgi:hypothetical protein
MIGEFERYHGYALRELIVGSPIPITIIPFDNVGRINSFLINDRLCIHIKHSSKRLPPWQFTFNGTNIQELHGLAADAGSLWVLLVCGQDGLAALTYQEVLDVNPPSRGVTAFIRVDRDPRTSYRINGSSGFLNRAVPRGCAGLLDDLTASTGLAA